MGIELKVEDHAKWDAPRYFWKEMGKAFIALVGMIDTDAYKQWQAEFPNIEHFFDAYVLEDGK